MKMNESSDFLITLAWKRPFLLYNPKTSALIPLLLILLSAPFSLFIAIFLATAYSYSFLTS